MEYVKYADVLKKGSSYFRRSFNSKKDYTLKLPDKNKLTLKGYSDVVANWGVLNQLGFTIGEFKDVSKAQKALEDFFNKHDFLKDTWKEASKSVAENCKKGFSSEIEHEVKDLYEIEVYCTKDGSNWRVHGNAQTSNKFSSSELLKIKKKHCIAPHREITLKSGLGNNRYAVISADGSLIACRDQQVSIVDTATEKIVGELKFSGWFRSICIAEDNSKMAIFGQEKILVYSWPSAKLLKEIKFARDDNYFMHLNHDFTKAIYKKNKKYSLVRFPDLKEIKSFDYTAEKGCGFFDKGSKFYFSSWQKTDILSAKDGEVIESIEIKGASRLTTDRKHFLVRGEWDKYKLIDLKGKVKTDLKFSFERKKVFEFNSLKNYMSPTFTSGCNSIFIYDDKGTFKAELGPRVESCTDIYFVKNKIIGVEYRSDKLLIWDWNKIK